MTVPVMKKPCPGCPFDVGMPAVAPVAVSVKGLSWKLRSDGRYRSGFKFGSYYADIYEISFRDGSYWLDDGHFSFMDQRFESAETAMVVAQKHHNARILSSIIPATKGGEGDAVLLVLRCEFHGWPVPFVPVNDTCHLGRAAMKMHLMRTRAIGHRQICQISIGPWNWGYSTETLHHRCSQGEWFHWGLGFIHLYGWDHAARAAQDTDGVAKP